MVFPKGAKSQDKVILNADKLSKMSLYVVEAENYQATKVYEEKLVQGSVYELQYPDSLFITLLSEEDDPGEFSLSYNYHRYNRLASETL